MRAAGVWSQQAFIKASNTGGDDRFGSALALGKDRLVVGARTEDGESAGINGDQNDNNAPDAGAVYIFSRTGAMWAQEAYVKASNPDPYDYFGSAVSMFGDMIAMGVFAEDGSGVGLGASQHSEGDPSAGAVYLFGRAQNGWSQVGYLKALNSDTSDEFGKSLALSGNTLVCGAHQEDSQFSGMNVNPYNEGAGDSGAVYVYH